MLSKKLLIIGLIFFLAVSAVSFVSAADVNINARISGGNPPPPPPPPPPPVPVYGCTDPLALNYNSSATIDDGSCIYDVYGCTDPTAVNYNPSATIDDGSCQPVVLGCTDQIAVNYNPSANQDDGSCEYINSGCMDPTAINYDSQATIDDGSCIYQLAGCTNPLADNYNPQATIDDGSCLISGCTNPLAGNYNPQATSDNGSCIVSGCTDPTAVNYNPQANVDNGTCSYDPNDIPGCTDGSALNYNPQATIDNGSCTYPVFGCTDSRALNYDSSASVNNGTCVYSVPTVPTGGLVGPNYYFFTNNNGLQLFLLNDNIDLLISHELLILVPNNFPKEVKQITAVSGGETWPFTYDTSSNQYLLQLNRFNTLGKNYVKLSVVYADNSVQEKNIIITVHPLGHVFSKLPEDKTRIFGISVLLYNENNKLIIQLSKINPDGTYGFMVENGRYKLVVFDNGQKIYDGRLFNVRNNIINQDIGLTLLEQILKIIKDILDNPVVEKVNQYTAPFVASLATISAFIAIPWWGFINYMQYLFTEPLAWFFRRKKKGWGVVYNSITKKPIDLAVIRLYDKTTGRLLKSRVTDREGRYNFLVSEGDYILEVVKQSMVFPSDILKDSSEDRQFTNIYHGELISITKDQKGIITANIPVDPPDAKISDQEVRRKNFRYIIQKNISLAGPIFALVSFAIFPSVLMASFAVIHIILYLLFRRLVAREKVNRWGIVLDAKTGKPISGTVAKIYSPEYNKMLEAQVTDRHGRYGFLAGNNIYYISAAKDGYSEAKTENIDLTHKKSEEVIGQDIKLEPIPSAPESNQLENNISKGDSNAPVENIDEIKIEEKEEVINPTSEETISAEKSPLAEIADKLKQEAEKSVSNQSPPDDSTETPPPSSEDDMISTTNTINQTGDKPESPVVEQTEATVINKQESESKFG
ncbi:MAG: hypothetical protein Q7K65_05880 [Candidatus Buchananbacteria bacterium]|nr:hypothetical protein [Candidatus Buchananbacteria bacterium]